MPERQGRVLWVVAGLDSNDWNGVYATKLLGPGPYTITNCFVGTSYWVHAFVDFNGDGIKQFWEAQGQFTNGSAFLSGCTSNVDIVLSETDSDNDGMPDWWEMKYGFSYTDPSDAFQDADADGLCNLLEYQIGSSPITSDTDGDGFSQIKREQGRK